MNESEAKSLARIMRGRVVKTLVDKGWRPPPVTTEMYYRFVDDVVAILGNDSGVRPKRMALDLTIREQQVLECSAAGIDASKELCLSKETIKSYQKHLRARLGAKTMPHAVAIAMREGILE